MNGDLEAIFADLWDNYVALTPRANRIRELLAEGAPLPNDHVAFRGLAVDGMGIDALAAPFLERGFRAEGEYHFEKKKLFARHFEHPDADVPKVFISELLVDQLSEASQSILHRLIEEGRGALPGDAPLMLAGRPWTPSGADYDQLLAESEYAAWMAAFGFRVNHFTVAVHQMDGHHLAEQNDRLEQAGFDLNAAGGKIKGSKEIGLIQSSTLAEPTVVRFSDGPRTIPGVYYELAERFEVDGALYPGFVTGSADKIFESTDVRRAAP